jgi:DnaA-homolog protein
MKQIPLAIGLGPEPGFDNFVIGPNGVALHALTQWRQPGPPVFLHGPAGTGKSHLLAAWAARVRGQGGQVAWFHASTPLPWTFDEAWTGVVIDDAQDLDEARQHAAFTLFVEAATHGTQMAAAARLPPVDLPLREDLRTRFGWGPVFELQPLDEAATRAVLRREADARGLMLSDEVMDYLLTRFERDLGSLKGLLHRLDRFSLAERRAVTVPLLKKMLTEGEVAA